MLTPFYFLILFLAARKSKIMEPILKWVGGKRQLLNSISQHLPANYNHYFEPFVGGGAVVFGLAPVEATINDFNQELINLYLVVRDFPTELIQELECGLYINSPEAFYHIRGWDKDEGFHNLNPIKKAARTLYLNHTCFNGLFRVNAKGFFNTPFGRYKNPTIYSAKAIRELSTYLKTINIYTGDYHPILDLAKEGDFVYIDPPYAPLSATSSFTSYIAGGWDNDEQVSLRDACNMLNERGVLFMQSNSSAQLIRDLYADYTIVEIEARRSLSARVDGRHNVIELLITNY